MAITDAQLPLLLRGHTGVHDGDPPTPQAVGVTRTRSVALAKTISKTIAVTRTRSAALVKQTSTTIAVTRTRAVALIRQTSKIFAVTRTRAVVVTFATLFTSLTVVSRTRTAALFRQTHTTKAVTRTRAVTVSDAVTIAALIAVTRTRAAALIKQTSKTFAVTRTRAVVVTGSSLVSQLVAVARTRSVALAKQTHKTLAVTRTRAAAALKQAYQTVSVTRTRAAALAKQTSKTFAVTRTRAIDVATDFILGVIPQLITVTRTRSATIVGLSLVGQLIAVTRTRSAALAKSTTRSVAVTRTRAAVTSKQLYQTVAVTRTRAATVLGELLLAIPQLVSVTRTRSATVIPATTFVQLITVTRTRTAALIKQTSKAFLVIRTRSVAFSSSETILQLIAVTRTRAATVVGLSLVGQLIAVTRTRSAALVKQTSTTIAVARTRAAALTKQTSATFVVTRTRAAALAKQVFQTVAVTRTRTASFSSSEIIIQLVTVTRTRTASTIRQIFQTLAVTRIRSAALARSTAKTLTLTRTRATTTAKKQPQTILVTRTRSVGITAEVILGSFLAAVTRTRSVFISAIFTERLPKVGIGGHINTFAIDDIVPINGMTVGLPPGSASERPDYVLLVAPPPQEMVVGVAAQPMFVAPPPGRPTDAPPTLPPTPDAIAPEVAITFGPAPLAADLPVRVYVTYTDNDLVDGATLDYLSLEVTGADVELINVSGIPAGNSPLIEVIYDLTPDNGWINELLTLDVAQDSCRDVTGNFNAAVQETYQFQIGVPTLVTLPEITGNPINGNTLTCSDGAWTESPTGFSFRWMLDDITIPAEITNTYDTVVGDIDGVITCEVIADNPSGDSQPAVADGVTVLIDIPVNTATPVLSGTGLAGDPITCPTGSWTNLPSGYLYQWKLDTIDIPNEITNTYTPVDGDVGDGLTCEVIASNGTGASAPVLSDEITILIRVPVLITLPEITGGPVTESTLFCSDGAWAYSPTGYAFQWKDDTIDIPGEITNQFVTSDAYVDHDITCEVVATNSSGPGIPAISNIIVVTAAVPVLITSPEITGPPEVGNELSSDTGAWTHAPTGYGYQWWNDLGLIGGAASPDYTSVTEDIGSAVYCSVIASNLAGPSESAISNNIIIVGPPPGSVPVNVDPPFISTGAAPAFNPGDLDAAGWFDLAVTEMFQERTGASATTSAGLGDPVGTIVNEGTLGGYFICGSTDAKRPILSLVDGGLMLSYAVSVFGEIELDQTVTLQAGMHCGVAQKYLTDSGASYDMNIGFVAGATDFFGIVVREAFQEVRAATQGDNASPSTRSFVFTGESNGSLPVGAVAVMQADFDTGDQTVYVDNIEIESIAHAWSGDSVSNAVPTLNALEQDDEVSFGNAYWMTEVPSDTDRALLEAWATSVPPGGTWQLKQADGRDYYLYTPFALSGGGAAPLLLMLHGGGGSAQGFSTKVSMSSLAEEHGFRVAYLEGTPAQQKTWNAGICFAPAINAGTDDIAYFDALVAAESSDITTLWMAGHSAGSSASYRGACEMAVTPDGIFAMSGAVLLLDAEVISAVTEVYHLHGADDTVAPVAGGVGVVGSCVWRSVADSTTLMEAAGATVTENILSDAEHDTDSLEEQTVLQFGWDLPTGIWMFMDGQL